MAKRYKKIGSSGDKYKQGKVYDENYSAEQAFSVKSCVSRFPNDWQLVEEDEFVLPDKWWVRVTEENEDVLNGWLDHDHEMNYAKAGLHLVGISVGKANWADGKNYNPLAETRSSTYDFGNEITYEQFKKYVLKEETMEKVEKWSKGTYVLFLEDLWHYKKGDIDVITVEVNNIDNISLSREEGVSIAREDYGEIKWFATKEEAETYLKEERGEIIGYKLKEEFSKTTIKRLLQIDDFDFDNFSNSAVEYSIFIKELKDMKVLDLWFEPVYEAKLALPKINGYDGEMIDGNVFKYGCKRVYVETCRGIINSTKISSTNFDIESITITDGFTVTIDEIKQIVEYFDSL